MTRPRIFINIHYLEIGGAERALIGLLDALTPDKAEVDLFVNQHTGEFMRLIPRHVRLLPQIPEYSAVERPVKEIIKEGHFGIALRRIAAKWRHRRYHASLPPESKAIDESIFQYVARCVGGALPDLRHLGRYDLAISFLHPHNLVLDKVDAARKICWVHTDYSAVHVNAALELPIWGAYDRIACISDAAALAFGNVFPPLKQKLMTIENILSPALIRTQAGDADVSDEMPHEKGSLKILSIGRYSKAKRFEAVPEICRRLLDLGLRFKWYIIGYGDDYEIRRNIGRFDVGACLKLLGKKDNPYPYIAACDIYAQPSRYEGKSVTVREAQILCKPVVITAYPTSSSQLTDGVDGRIVGMDIEECAKGIFEFACDSSIHSRISNYLSAHDYGNESEIDRILKLI